MSSQSNVRTCQLLIIIVFIHSSTAYVNLLPTATWAQNASTIAGRANGVAGSSNGYLDSPGSLAISPNDILYIADQDNNRLVMIDLTSSTIIRNVGSGQGSGSNQFYWPNDISLTQTSMYILDSNNYRVQKWSINGTNPSTVVDPINYSFYMFVDKYLNLYVSLLQNHEVICFAPGSSVSTTVAGTGSAGTQAYRLDTPLGLFVDGDLTLYIADSNNHRIQMWPSGASTGTTVAGSGVAGTSLSRLDTPSAVTFDTNGYMYISDQGNNRILRWSPSAASGICIAACTGSSGVTNNKLYYPVSLAFDSDGSLYVADNGNNRVQKFQVYNNSNQITSQSPSTVQITSADPTTELLTSTMEPSSVVPIQSTTVIQSTVESSTIVVTTTTSNAIRTSQIPTTVNHMTTAMSSVYSTPMGQSTVAPTPMGQSTVGSTPMGQSIVVSTPKGQSTVVTAAVTTQSPTLWTSKDHPSTTTPTILSSTSTISTSNYSKMIISLWPNNPSVMTPLEMRRSEHFSISSSLQLDSTQSLAVTEQWFIEKCFDSLCSIKELLTLPLSTMMLGELFVPSQTLDYGLYQMTLTVRMSGSLQLSSSAITYVKIISSPIRVQLIQFGPSMIVQAQQQALILDPGRFSIDPDQTYFNANNWMYTYFCAVYNQEMFTSSNQTMLSIENSSCFNSSTGNGSLWGYATNATRSSLIISGGVLSSNQTYHFQVQLNNIYNSSISYTADLLVQIEDKISMTIIIKCTISAMCIPKNEYEMINPTTQIALTSFCIENCYYWSSTINIDWNIYYGIFNLTTNSLQWIMFDNKTQYVNKWFFGMNSSNFTATTDLVATYPSIKYWRFEVIYSNGSMRSIAFINFVINSPPSNGTCSIYPLIGTTTSLFTIDCFNWFDEDGIKDYLFYTWTMNRSNRLILAYNSSIRLQVRMPIGDEFNSGFLQVTVRIRDKFGCTTELDLPSIAVTPEMNTIVSLIESRTNNSNPLREILYSGHQNDVCQILTSVSQVLNIFAQQNRQLAINNNISAVSISISPLHDDHSSGYDYSWLSSNGILNFTDYNRHLNTFAGVQEDLILFMNNLTISSIDSIVLQGSTLSQLTATTNQLTRNALMIASTRCLELSSVLLDYAQVIPYEDVQLAGNYIAQCASNVLTAVNALLQNRTRPLDLDTNRANAFPIDYDTDLELIWSNPNLFADGDDFSKETIEKNRNIYYQKQLATLINQQFQTTLLMITNALTIHHTIEQSTLINTSSIIMSLKRLTSTSISQQTIDLNNNTHIRFPDNLQFDSTISLQCVQTPLSIAGNHAQSSTMNLSNLLLITIFDEHGEEVHVNTTIDKTIELFISRDMNMIVPSMSLQNVSSLTDDPLLNNHQFNLHLINITQINPNLSISIHLEMSPLDPTLGYMLIYKFDRIPQLNSSTIQIDNWTMLCPRNLTHDGIYSYFIDNERSVGHQSVIFGVRELNSTEFDMYCMNMSKNILRSDRVLNFSSNYQLRIFTSGCYYLDTYNNWQSNGLLVGSLTNHIRTQCFSTHLSTFASGFIVLPKPINWNYVFANADFIKNKTIYLTIIVVMLLFIILSIYARHLDKKDQAKLGFTILSNNQRPNNYFYQIVVFTGQRRHAGTSAKMCPVTQNIAPSMFDRYHSGKCIPEFAKVHFVLSGDNYETDAWTLANADRKVLQRGSIDSFIIDTPKPLGLLNYMRIWHDNAGRQSAPSWFLKYIIVRDLQTMQKSYFICQQWLSIEKADGKIDRVLPVSSDEQMRELVYSLSRKAYHSLSDGHLWFSIFSRPPATKFTRVQRCICCFVLLYTVMLLDILYYQQTSEAPSNSAMDGFSLGPFHFTKQQIIIGIITDILIFIPSTFLVTFFRHIRQHRSSNQTSTIINLISKSQAKQAFHDNDATIVETKKKRHILFPWWCLFVAYGISYLLIGISILLIIARGIEFGDMKIRKWLASLTIGFFSSILLSQPIKVLGIAIFLAMVHRCSKRADTHKDFIDENEEFYLNGGDEHIHSIEKPSPTTNQHFTKVRYLSKTKVAQARTMRLRDIQMWSFIRQLLFYGCYMSILYAISYADRSSHSYQQVHHLRNLFLNSHNSTHNYMKITTVDDYWKWLEESFVSNIRAQTWYNGNPPHELSAFINDKSNRLIGWPVMRQLRVKSDSKCRVPALIQKFISHCGNDYSLSNEDHQSWFPGWTSTIENQSYSHSIQNAFVYRSGGELDSYPLNGIFHKYDDGGYVHEFRGRLNDMKSNLTQLRQLSWIDSRTRAVILQLTLYNPNVQLFTSITFLIEFLSTSGVLSQCRIEPIALHDQFQGVSSIMHGIGGIIYLLFIIYFMCIEIRLLMKLKKKYFYSIWSFIQWGTILSSWIGLGIYIWRIEESHRLGTFFQQTNGYEYLNLQQAVDIDGMLRFLFGLCCFLSTIRFIYLFRFHARLSQFLQVLDYVKKDLFYFSGIFFIVYVTFICLFYLLFHSKLFACSDVFHTMEMLFEMLLFKFDSGDLYQADMLLGPLVFTLFIYFVVFICCTMMISIINNGFRHIRSMNKLTLNDREDLLLFVFDKMKHALGIKKKNELKTGGLEHRHCLDELSDRIDQLTTTLTRLSVTSSVASPSTMTLTTSMVYDDICVEHID